MLQLKPPTGPGPHNARMACMPNKRVHRKCCSASFMWIPVCSVPYRVTKPPTSSSVEWTSCITLKKARQLPHVPKFILLQRITTELINKLCVILSDAIKSTFNTWRQLRRSMVMSQSNNQKWLIGSIVLNFHMRYETQKTQRSINQDLFVTKVTQVTSYYRTVSSRQSTVIFIVRSEVSIFGR